MEPRSYREFTDSVIRTLESLELDYAIGGSFASMAYSEVRTTVDIDISVVLPLAAGSRFVQAFERLGYYVSLDSIIDALVHGLPFNIIDAESGYKADIFVIDPDAPTLLEQSVMYRRRRGVYDEASGAEAMLYSPEDVIVYKLKYYVSGRMTKHLRDIGAMLIVQREALDYDYIAHWAGQVGAAEVWRQLLDEYKRDLQNSASLL
jgi:hypothetical protein